MQGVQDEELRDGSGLALVAARIFPSLLLHIPAGREGSELPALLPNPPWMENRTAPGLDVGKTLCKSAKNPTRRCTGRVIKSEIRARLGELIAPIKLKAVQVPRALRRCLLCHRAPSPRLRRGFAFGLSKAGAGSARGRGLSLEKPERLCDRSPVSVVLWGGSPEGRMVPRG